MPDLTLYRDDVTVIRDALKCYRNVLRANQRETGTVQNVERLGDLLIDRLVQNLHPARDKKE